MISAKGVSRPAGRGAVLRFVALALTVASAAGAGAAAVASLTTAPELAAVPVNSGSGGHVFRPDLPCSRPYSQSSPWNTPIGPRPVYDARSDYHVGALGGELSSDPTRYTYPVYDVDGDVPRVPVRVTGVYSKVVDGRALAIEPNTTVHMPIPGNAREAAGTDGQMILVDRRTGDEWGAWRLHRSADGRWEAVNAYRYNVRWSGVPPYTDGGRPFGSRGAGMPYLAGLVRPCEIARGWIDHALAFAYDFPRSEFVFPATKSDGKSQDPRDMPEGSRLQLDPSLTQDEIYSWGCTGACYTIARALQVYGMYVVDASGRPKLIVEYEATAGWNGLITAATVNPIPLSAFKLLMTCTITGTDGDDILRGTEARDVLCGRGGNDELDGMGGDDTLYADAGDDVVTGGAGNDELFGGGGDDVVTGGPGRDDLNGGADRDRLVADDGEPDAVRGGPGTDVTYVDSADRTASADGAPGSRPAQ